MQPHSDVLNPHQLMHALHALQQHPSSSPSTSSPPPSLMAATTITTLADRRSTLSSSSTCSSQAGSFKQMSNIPAPPPPTPANYPPMFPSSTSSVLLGDTNRLDEATALNETDEQLPNEEGVNDEEWPEMMFQPSASASPQMQSRLVSYEQPGCSNKKYVSTVAANMEDTEEYAAAMLEKTRESETTTSLTSSPPL
jgi:hypothetical protein